jgi:hypothetical protein
MPAAMEGLLGLTFGVLLHLGAVLIFTSYVYSRFLFYGYLRKNHPENLRSIEGVSGLNLLSFDKTDGIRTFRMNMTEDWGDPRIMAMKKKADILFKTGVFLTMGLAIGLVVAGIVAVIIRH